MKERASLHTVGAVSLDDTENENFAVETRKTPPHPPPPSPPTVLPAHVLLPHVTKLQGLSNAILGA